MKRLEGKVAIVTGATAGIGRAIAVLFGSEGAKVVASGRNEERGAGVVREIRDAGGEAEFFRADICSEGDLSALVAFAVEKYGRLDVLVNNAGSGLSKPLVEITGEEWDHVLAADAKSVFLTMKLALPHLVETNGSIVNLSSASVFKPMPRMHGYCAAKAAVNELSKTAAAEYAPQGVRVNVVAPGLTRTSILSQYTEEGVQRVAQAIPMQRVGEPEDKVYTDIEEYLKSEQKVSEDGIAQVTQLLPLFEGDVVAYEDMKAYVVDEDADLQETKQDLELIGLIGKQNWLAKKTGDSATA